VEKCCNIYRPKTFRGATNANEVESTIDVPLNVEVSVYDAPDVTILSRAVICQDAIATEYARTRTASLHER
jgi:hypothetical protein